MALYEVKLSAWNEKHQDCSPKSKKRHLAKDFDEETPTCSKVGEKKSKITKEKSHLKANKSS